VESIKTFKGLPHRIEVLGSYESVEFINDSKATNADATLTALKALTGRPIFLIAGGISKEEGIEVLLKKNEFSKVKEVILIGVASGEFAKSIVEYNNAFPENSKNYLIAGTLEKAVKLAFISARKVKNSIVLLSPLCASFDQFKNYNERGECFRKAFEELKNKDYQLK
jgi:UDP-N-acetylmuramoylalanine--D-glutamate ligase